MAAKTTVAPSGTKAIVNPSRAAITQFMKGVEKEFGEGTLQVGQSDDFVWVSTGSLTLDMALGGGLVNGRLTEIWGAGEVGKTTMCMEIVREHQTLWPKRLVGWVNIERSFSWDWAVAHGVEKSTLYLAEPDDAQQAADQIAKMVRSGLFSVVVIDSLGGMIGQSEMAKNADQAVVAEVAKVITRMVKQLTMIADDNGTTIVLVNQQRTMGIGTGKTWNGTSGGNAKDHSTTHKIKVRRTGADPLYLGKGDTRLEVGHQVAAQIQRNKVAVPNKVAYFYLLNQDTDEFGELGIDQATEAYTMGLRYGLITKLPTKTGSEGNMHVLPGLDDQKFNGEKATIKALRANPAVVDYIRSQVVGGKADLLPPDQVPEEAAEVTEDDDEFDTGASPSAGAVDAATDQHAANTIAPTMVAS